MARSTDHLLAPLLDRLCDDDPGTQVEAGLDYGVEDLKASVARDLVSLLNARRSPPELPLDAPEAERSLLAYGMPDLTGFNPRSDRDRAQVVQAMERAIRLFEPRLGRIKVELAEVDSLTGHLRFRLDALLRVHPRPIAISFDTMLHPGSKSFAVRKED